MAARSYLGIGLTVALCVSACDGKVAPGLPLDADIEEWDFGDDAGPRTPVPGRDAGTGIDASRSDEADADVSEPGPSEPNDPPPEPPKPDAGGKPSTPQPSASGDCSRVTDVLLCDDFESVEAGGQPDMTKWTGLRLTSESRGVIDNTRAARGSKSMHFSTVAGQIAQLEKRLPSLPNNTLYGRMFVYLDKLPTGPAYVQWLLAAVSQLSGGPELRLAGQRRDSGENTLGIGSDGGETGDWNTGGTEPGSRVRAGEWICVSWLFQGSTNETKVWVNDVEQTSLHLTADTYRRGAEDGKQFIHPQYEMLRVGWWMYDGSGMPRDANLWIDEIILDDQQIRCNP